MGVATGKATFTWNGKPCRAEEGDTIAAALWRAGMTTVARWRKRHLSMGYSGAHAVGALAVCDGVPNVRLDQILARDLTAPGLQNGWPSARYDILPLLQLLPSRWLYGRLEFGALTRQTGPAFRMADRTMAFLAGAA